MTLDREGVGELITMAAERGRKTRPDLKLGICGEHGGDPASIAFCEEAGLDYVSCSPFRVPIARLAAAQAALGRKAAKHGVKTRALLIAETSRRPSTICKVRRETGWSTYVAAPSRAKMRNNTTLIETRGHPRSGEHVTART